MRNDERLANVPVGAPPTIRTRQLLLRPPAPSDVDALFAIQGDADAMRYTFVASDRDATARYLDAYAARFDTDGFAPWTVVLAADDRVVGWGGLNKDPVEPEWGPEIAYFFHRGVWGRGLATELVSAALDYAFGSIALSEVFAFTRPANAASRRVLEKCGFARMCYVPELERDRYVTRRPLS
jgi:RimJ/RimL family protein N-acetyltransferase